LRKGGGGDVNSRTGKIGEKFRKRVRSTKGCNIRRRKEVNVTGIPGNMEAVNSPFHK
jgi:hypothetical protein